MTNKMQVLQAIVVEGRDDVAAVSVAVDALIIPTHGFGITKETWELIAKADKSKGLIILTDPDFSGEEIRRKITEKFPRSLQAYIREQDALKDGDIGVENAKPDVIVSAIKKALSNSERFCEDSKKAEPISMRELISLGLAGKSDAAGLRNELCDKLGIGHSNAKTLIKKLAHWNIGIKELEQEIQEITNSK